MDYMEPEHVLEFISTEPVQEFLAQLQSDNIDINIAKAALVEKHLFEGRALYSMNCRPCHGDSVAGDGPMADGFKLRPINFTDNGTIEDHRRGLHFLARDQRRVGITGRGHTLGFSHAGMETQPERGRTLEDNFGRV